MKAVLRIAVLGDTQSLVVQSVGHNLVLRALGFAGNAKIEKTSVSKADIVLLHPHKTPFGSMLAAATVDSLGKRLPERAFDYESRIRRLVRLRRGQRLLAVSHENLDRAPWHLFGEWLRRTSIPRLTFWPRDLDPGGYRMPNWWNDIWWPDLPPSIPSRFTRFGEYLDLDVLCQPQNVDDEFLSRKDAAVILTRRADFPRPAVLDRIREAVKVDVVPACPPGGKYELIRKYRYYVATENSLGYGYATEKVPEARQAGCLPVGYIRSPMIDFTEGSVFASVPEELPGQLPPLLASRPSLSSLFEYLGEKLDIG